MNSPKPWSRNHSRRSGLLSEPSCGERWPRTDGARVRPESSRVASAVFMVGPTKMLPRRGGLESPQTDSPETRTDSKVSVGQTTKNDGLPWSAPRKIGRHGELFAAKARAVLRGVGRTGADAACLRGQGFLDLAQQ